MDYKKLKTSQGVFHILPWTLSKVNKYKIKVPIELTSKVGHMKDVKEGIYLWIFPCGLIRKVGLFGEGVTSNFNSRYISYRNAAKNMGNNQGEYVLPSGKSNGSVIPIQCVIKKLEIGEEVKIAVLEVPTITEYCLVEGFKRPMTINKAMIEKDIKNKIKTKNPNQLYLN